MYKIKTILTAIFFIFFLCPKLYADSWWMSEIESRMGKNEAPDTIVIMNEPALVLVAREGRFDLVEKLVAMGANINKQISLEEEYPDKSKWKKGFMPGWVEIETDKGNVNADSGNYPYTALMAAAKAGKAEVVKFLLEKGADPSVKTSRGDTALSYATASGNKDAVTILLSKTGKEGIDLDGDLRQAALRGFTDTVRVLVDKGANVNSKDQRGSTALIWAVSGGHKDTVKALLDKGADIDIFISVQGESYTPLRYALTYGYSDIAKMIKDKNPKVNHYDDLISALTEQDIQAVKLLLDKGENPNKQNSFGLMPIEIASRSGNIELVRILADHGANVNFYNGMDRSSLTPLMMASSGGNIELVKLLLEKGAKVNIGQRAGMTALGLAAAQGHIEIVKWLLDKGADVPIESWPTNPLEMAKRNGHTEIVDILEGIINAKTNVQNQLIQAVSEGNLELTKIILDGGANPNKVKDPFHEKLPLLIAAEKGNTEILKLLLDKGAYANAGSGEATALVIAAREGHSDIVKVLLEKNAYVDEKNRDWWTSLMYAAQRGDSNVVQMLVENGADLDLKNREGKSALDLAKEKGHQEITKILLKEKNARDSGQVKRQKKLPGGTGGIFGVTIN